MEPATQTTTSEHLYKRLCDEKCLKYEEFVADLLKDCQIVEREYDGNLSSYLDYKGYLEDLVKALNDFTVPTFSFKAPEAIRNALSPKFQSYEEAKLKTAKEIEELKAQYESEWQDRCKAEHQRVSDSISPLAKKHKKLMSYRDKLQTLMTRYGISPSDVKVSDDISREEFEKLLTVSLAVCKDFDKKQNGLLQLALSPLQEEDNLVIVLYLLFVLILGKITLPILGGWYMFHMVHNTKIMYSKVEDLRVAGSLMYDISLERFIPESERYVEPEKNTAELEQKIQELNDDLLAHDPQKIYDAEVKAYNTDAGLQYVAGSIESEITKTKNIVADRLSYAKGLLEKVTAICDEETAKIQRFGDYSNPSAVLNTRFTLGYVNDVIPQFVDVGLKNFNFVGTYNKDLVNHLKVLFLNMLLNVRANKLVTTVFDKEYLGQMFSEFITPETNPFIKIESKDANKVMEDAQKKSSEGILELKTDNILEYNEKNEKLGMVTRVYYLYIFLTGLDDKFTENKAYMEFLSYSANTGVFIWTIYPRELPGCQNVRGMISPASGEPIQYDYDLGSRSIESFKYALEHNKMAALDYRKGYLYKYLPEDKWWKTSGVKGINVRMGLENGDPAKPTLLYFDDKNVHFLLGGATGAGKSVAIDCAMQSMIHEYAPDELQLVYIDLKNAEVRKYTENGRCIIPHCLIAAGTTDGEYCLSIFNWAYEEMVRRMNLCGRYGQQKVEGLRKKFDDPSREDYNPEVHLPRIVILIDEFQVMFNATVVPQKIINEITGKLTSLVKLARAASMHLWFTSQEMSGTLSKNVLDNFSNRGALRCSADVSNQLLGNDASGKITEKVGWMYTNDSAGQDPNANKLWKVPFAPTDDLMQGMAELREKAAKEGKPCLDAKFFDEKQGRTQADLQEAYDTFEGFKNPSFLVLGERTIYSTKPTPVNFRITQDDKENVLILASDRQDAMDLIGTLITNIKNKDGATTLLLNCADKDTIFLLDLENEMPEGWEDFLYANRPVEEILDDLDEVADLREETGNTESPLYVGLLMWEKLDGIGIGESYKFVERASQIIRRLNTLNVHVIFVCRDKGLPNGFVGLCNHKIVAKVDGALAYKIIDDNRPESFPSPDGDNACFAIYKYGSDLQKFKIYRHKLKRVLESREL